MRQRARELEQTRLSKRVAAASKRASDRRQDEDASKGIEDAEAAEHWDCEEIGVTHKHREVKEAPSSEVRSPGGVLRRRRVPDEGERLRASRRQ